MENLNNSEDPEKSMQENKHYTDLAYLEKLSNGDKTFILEMISVFLAQTPMTIESMWTYFNNKDWNSLRGIAHKSKPSLAFMGIKDLESVAISIEEYADKESSLELLPDLIKKMEFVCKEAIKELELIKIKLTNN